MGLFSLRPSSGNAGEVDANMNLYLGNEPEAADIRNVRTMPAEWFPQSGIQLTWPHVGTDWNYMLAEVTDCYLHLVFEIASREKLLIVAPQPEVVRTLLEEKLPRRATDNITYHACPTNDTWARDHGFITVMGPGGPELLDFRFNGWGGKFGANHDNAINRRLYDDGVLSGRYVDALGFELEGGSIESDGCGTLLTTSTCLLNPNRNALLSQEEIGDRLKELLGVQRILWLDHGALAGDDTDAHVDTLARFCPDNTIVYVACPDEADEHYYGLQKMEEQLRTFRTAEGGDYRLVPVPLPDAIYDEEGERLPATYANFLIMNSAVLYPTYGQPDKDDQARQALQCAFPKYDLVAVDCRSLIRQHGSLHCATMQFPRGVLVRPNI